MAVATVSLQQAYHHCQQVTRKAARNFYFAFITLPKRQRQAIYAVYAFCRLCDDIADEAAPVEQQVSALEEVRAALRRCYAGEPEGPIFTALAHAAATYRIPQEYLHEVVAGVAMDLTQRRYATFDELRAYCHRVASAVGLICIHIFGFKDPRAEEYAVALGLAMQLTNIMRDLKEDALRGRVYVPQDELERFGYSEQWLMRGIINRRYVAFMRFQAERTRRYFQEGSRLLPLLPRRSRGCVAVLHGLYSRLLARMEAQGFDVFQKRIGLPTWEKVVVAARLWVMSLLLPGRAMVRRS